MDGYLLALETATDVCGVALWADDRLVDSTHLHRPRMHAEHLTPLVRSIWHRHDLVASDMTAIAVSMGPGSYTGLRIGVSTAKGLALAGDAALIGVPTLEALAAPLQLYGMPGDVIGAFIDARRDEVYAAAYQLGADRHLAPYAQTDALTTDELADWLGAVDDRLWLVGNGAEKAAPALQPVADQHTVVSSDAHAPSAAWVARRARPRWTAGTVEDVSTFEPYYLKEFAGTRPEQSPLERLSS